jgi:hypothetical protein
VHRHRHFDLWLDANAELAALLGSPITERTTLHEWPLSCVQRLRLADGRSLVYKVQGEPTVEPDFYARVRSPVLVAAQRIGRPTGPAALLLEDVAAPALSELRLDEAEAVRAVEDVLAAIAGIDGDPPVYADVRGEAAWASFAAKMVEDVRAMAAGGGFEAASDATVDAIARAAESPALRAAVEGEPGYVNTDLKAAHVFVRSDGYKVLDWQRPIRGPAVLDRATLLRSLGVDPRGRVAPGVLTLQSLLLIAWFAACDRRWVGPGYGAAIARLAAELPS